MSKVYLKQTGFDSDQWYLANTKHQGFDELDNIRLMSYGRRHCFLVQNDNDLYGIGSNESGCLGVEEWNASKNLQRIHVEQFQERTITNIVCGSDFTVVVLDGVELYATGCNVDGAVGNDRQEEMYGFVKVNMSNVRPFTRITHLKAGFYMWGFVTDNTHVYMCGYGGVGQMCNGMNDGFNGHPIPIISGDHLQDATIIDFACPSAHGVLLTTKGLFTWGWNNTGQLGTNSKSNSCELARISSDIRSGFIASDPFKDSTIVIKPDLQMFACGLVNFMHDEKIDYCCYPTLTQSTHRIVKRAVRSLRTVNCSNSGNLVADNIVYDKNGNALLDLTNEEIVLIGAGYENAFIVTRSKPIINLSRMVGSRYFGDIDLVLSE